MINKTLEEFERYTKLGPTFACELLAIPYSTYAQLRNGTRTMKTHTERHIQAVSRLSPTELARHIEEHVRGRTN